MSTSNQWFLIPADTRAQIPRFARPPRPTSNSFGGSKNDFARSTMINFFFARHYVLSVRGRGLAPTYRYNAPGITDDVERGAMLKPTWHHAIWKGFRFWFLIQKVKEKKQNESLWILRTWCDIKMIRRNYCELKKERNVRYTLVSVICWVPSWENTIQKWTCTCIHRWVKANVLSDVS